MSVEVTMWAVMRHGSLITIEDDSGNLITSVRVRRAAWPDSMLARLNLEPAGEWESLHGAARVRVRYQDPWSRLAAADVRANRP